MPQASERSLARPMISPRFPAIKPVIRPPSGLRGGRFLRVHGLFLGLVLGFGRGFLLHHGHDVLFGGRRRLGKRRVELRADHQPEADDEEENQRDHDPGEAAIGEVVAAEAGQRDREQGGGQHPPAGRRTPRPAICGSGCAVALAASAT